MEKEDFLTIGKIISVHGLKGNFRISSYADSISVFKPGNPLILKTADAGEREYTIRWVKPHSKTILLSLIEIDNRNSAEALIGAELLIEKATLPELDDGTYYWFDIIGLSVFTNDDQYIGRVESIIPTGSNDVFVVKDPKKDHSGETLIPALESVVLEIDLKRKTMRVDLPEGL